MADAVNIREKWAWALVAFLASLGLLIVPAVEKAGATAVTPARLNQPTAASATLQPGELSWFIPNNAYFQNAVGCTTSAANFEIAPSDYNPGAGLFSYNQNRGNGTFPGVGDYSDDHGGVIMNIDDHPTFNACAVYGPLGMQTAQSYNTISNPPPGPLAPASVTVDDTFTWTVTANDNNVKDPSVSIAVPPSALTITIPTLVGACLLDVAPDRPQAAYAKWVNGNPQTGAPSQMLVDTQIKFAQAEGSVDCETELGFSTSSFKGDIAIAQFEADYQVTSGANPVLIQP